MEKTYAQQLAELAQQQKRIYMETLRKVERLRQEGHQITLDDRETGYVVAQTFEGSGKRRFRKTVIYTYDPA